MAIIEDTTDLAESGGGTPPARPDHGGGDHGAHGGGALLTNIKLAMWLFLASDCLFFGAFISAYLLYRGRKQTGPTPRELFDIPFTSATSFILLMSSLGMVLALAAIQRGDLRRFRLWTIATALFGATFVAGQIYEFTHFYREGLRLGSNLFGCTFYVLTGFHGLHVLVGLLAILAVLWRSRRPGHYSSRSHFGIEAAEYYWHFVDIVWVILFVLLYLL